MSIRNRVIEMRMMSPKDIAFNDKNWRTHPDKQSKALEGLLSEIGIAGGMLCYYSERNGGALTLIDGHLRKKVAPGEQWPVLITDLTDAEADTLLAAYDPISALAGADKNKLDGLLREVHASDARVTEMLSGLADDNLIYYTEGDKAGSSPWDRMGGDADEGVMFIFGAIQHRLPIEVYNRFYDNCPEEDIDKHLIGLLKI